jgi:hypothetical protein
MGASAPFFFSTRFEGKEAAPFETASFALYQHPAGC